ncbi:MAG: transposase, partial [Proteobacteria bacterium]|nr:transposase [Pseudomonadota bacterium]
MRFIALERMAEGESPAAVSASFGLHRTWAYKVRAKARGRGKGARAVRDCVAALHGKLTLHFLPGYAPEPNPDELAWSHAKRTGNARRPLRAGEHLEDRIESQLADMAARPDLIRPFCRHPSVAYIADCRVTSGCCT